LPNPRLQAAVHFQWRNIMRRVLSLGGHVRGGVAAAPDAAVGEGGLCQAGGMKVSRNPLSTSAFGGVDSFLRILRESRRSGRVQSVACPKMSNRPVHRQELSQSVGGRAMGPGTKPSPSRRSFSESRMGPGRCFLWTPWERPRTRSTIYSR
jgi:hypothetical protein